MVQIAFCPNNWQLKVDDLTRLIELEKIAENLTPYTFWEEIWINNLDRNTKREKKKKDQQEKQKPSATA